MKIVYVFADRTDNWNSSEWRCAAPARAINRTCRHSAELVGIDDFGFNKPQARQACSQADVIVVERNLFGSVLSAIQHWKAHDKIVIADFDDAYQVMPPTNPSYYFWGEGKVEKLDGRLEQIDPPPMTQFRWGLRLVNAATVPSKRLADDWRSYTEIHYLPNYIDLENYQNNSLEKHDGIIIGWGGSVSHLQSFTNSGVLTALQQVCKMRPAVKVMICGNDVRILEKLNLPPEQVIYQPWVPYSHWANVLTKFDIGLAPLSGEYDDRRSWIKVLEYMVMKIPWVASEGPAYSDLRQYGWLVKNNPNTWERVLLDMVDHLEDYQAEAACEPYLFGIGQSVDENVDKILSTYSSISTRVAAENSI